MSDNMPCNHCTMQWLKRNIKKTDKVITRNSLGNLGGVDVFVVPKNKTLPPNAEMKGPSKKLPNGCKVYNKYHKMWFMELTDFCAC